MKILMIFALIITSAYSAHGQDIQVNLISDNIDTLANGRIFRSLILELKNHEQNSKGFSAKLIKAIAYNQNIELFEFDTSVSSDHMRPNNFYLSLRIPKNEKPKEILKIKGKIELKQYIDEQRKKSNKINASRKAKSTNKYVDFDIDI